MPLESKKDFKGIKFIYNIMYEIDKILEVKIENLDF